MELKKQLIKDIEILPEHALRAISVLVRDYVMFASGQQQSVRPPFKFGTMKGKVWMSDDFDAPMEDFKEYM